MIKEAAGVVAASLAVVLLVFLAFGLLGEASAILWLGLAALAMLAAGALLAAFLFVQRLSLAQDAAQKSAAELAQIRKTVEAQNEALRLFSSAAKSAKLGYFAWDLLQDRCILCSEEYALMHGVSVEQYLSKATNIEADALYVHPDDRQFYVTSCNEAVKNKLPLDIQYRILTDAGEVRHVREIEHSFVVENGVSIRTEGMIQDITDLRRSETLLMAAMNASATAFAIFDPQDRLILANPSYVATFGEKGVPMEPGTPHAVIIRGVAALGTIRGSAKELETWVRRRLTLRQDPAKAALFQTDRGLWFEMTDVLLEDGHVFTMAMDVTERHHMETRLQAAQRMEAVGQLAAGMAHDFNNLLGIIHGNAELLNDRSGQDTELVAAILRASRRAAELTQSLLAFSRRQPLRPTDLDLASLIETLLPQFERSLERPVAIESRIAPDLPPLRADGGQLENALINLLLNAVQATPVEGRITLSCFPFDKTESVPGLDRARDYLCITIEDTGKGMEPEILAQAFEPFFTTGQNTRSSGLGLSMVYGFAQQSGGHIDLSSLPGKGTKVRLILPAAEVDSQQTPAVQRSDRPESVQGHGECVLILEDNTAVRTMLKAQLERLGYRVAEAGTVEWANKLLASEQIAVALVDIMLTDDCSGPQFVARARHVRPDLKVVYISGYSAERAALDPGATLLTKPFTRRDLAQALNRELSGGQQPALT